VTGYLLDTNVLSEIVKRRPHPSVMTRLRSLPESSLFPSVICNIEIRFGAARHPDGEQLWTRISTEVINRLAVLPLGLREAIAAGDVLASLEARGQVIGIEDVLIASTALTQDLTVFTRNTRHLSRVEGLRVECWWP
jgi:tRNA(fMet)-specific endonuclease VapC